MKAPGSCEHGPFFDGLQSPHPWADRALGYHPVVEVPATQLLRDPMQENRERFLLTPPMLSVLVDASSFPQSDVLTPVVQLQPNIEHLKPLADFLATWQRMPDISQWILRTIRHGYTIQFRKGPPPFSGILPTTVRPGQATVLRQEIVSLLEKGATEELPPTRRKSGFYSRYFAVPKRRWWFAILDLRRLNLTLRVSKFKMLTVKSILSQIQPRDWFVTIDLKDAYFHIQIVKSSSGLLLRAKLINTVFSR